VSEQARPTTVFDPGVQHERTALSWERTAVAMMVAGAILGRYASSHGHFALGTLGVMWVVVGGVVLLWAARHYEDLHGPLRAGETPANPTVTRRVGISTVAFSGVALILAVLLTLVDP
jgi:uncharacterized membrane protein YidH (DUF202 family)